MIDLINANVRNIFRLSTASIRRKPDYMIIGAQKSGTTTLFNMLSQHPEIKNPKNKEMHYFDNRNIFSLRKYRSMYPFSLTSLTGEATPLYLYYPGVPERVKILFPKCKFIIILRNPVDRAYSHYQMRVRREKEALSFEQAIEAEESRLAKAKEQYEADSTTHNTGLLSHSYKDRGIYYRQLEQWLAVFDKSQIHTLSYENFITNPQKEYDKICDFLKVSHYTNVVQGRSSTYSYPEMLPDTRAQLEQYYFPFNQQLFEITGEEFSWNKATV